MELENVEFLPSVKISIQSANADANADANELKKQKVLKLEANTDQPKRRTFHALKLKPATAPIGYRFHKSSHSVDSSPLNWVRKNINTSPDKETEWKRNDAKREWENREWENREWNRNKDAEWRRKFENHDSDQDSEKHEESGAIINIKRNSAQLIDEHLQEIQVRADGHARAAALYERRDRIIGYPVTLLSSFIASTLMMGLTYNKETDGVVLNAVSLGLSVVSFVLSLSRDYLRYTSLFQAHDISSKLYTNLLRSIEVRLIGNHITQEDKRDMFKDIIDQMSIIEQYELAIPDAINKLVRSEMFIPRSVLINETLRQEEMKVKK